jgi:hypothetical protein
MGRDIQEWHIPGFGASRSVTIYHAPMSGKAHLVSASCGVQAGEHTALRGKRYPEGLFGILPYVSCDNLRDRFELSTVATL